MRFLFAFLLLFILIEVDAQTNVGIGTTAPTNRLHVVNTADPVKLEGVSSGATTDSILTINASGVVKRRTVASVLSGSAGWLLTGNTGTTTTYLGTSNAVGLYFRTNNLRSGFIDFDSTKRNNSYGNRAMANFSTTAVGNNAFGYQALSSLTAGNNNVALGDSAAFSVAAGSDNVAIGSDALGATVSSANLAIGSYALSKNTVGSNNMALGVNALAQNTNTSINIAIGNAALSAATTSTEQLAMGYNSGLGITNGSFNTLLGHYTLSSLNGNTSYNTMVGYQAGYQQTSGSYNTYAGYGAGFQQVGGSNNTYLGYQAGPTTAASYSNSVALGNGAIPTQSNMVQLGNPGITRLSAAVTLTTTSDGRVKTHVQEDVKGLSFIALLRPVTYNYDLTKMNNLLKVPVAARTANPEKEQIRYSGFIAQEVEAAAQKAGYDFSGVSKPQNSQDLYGLSYAEMVVPLVKAVQELKSMVEKQQQEIEALKAKISQQKQ
jgi:trimeric autotransporter adhesin